MNRRTAILKGIPSLGLASLAAQETQVPDEIRLICVAPSPYTQRVDSLRAGYLIRHFIALHIDELKLPLKATLYDGAKRLIKPGELSQILRPLPKVLVLGSSTWSQGSNRFVRQFFELVGSESLLGVKASCWATSGGAHTGGETVIGDMQRSLQGMGAAVFSLGQKLMVITTDEREGPPPGHFTNYDLWFLDQFAKMLILQACENPETIHRVTAALKFELTYYRFLPKKPEDFPAYVLAPQAFINKAANPSSAERKQLLAVVL